MRRTTHRQTADAAAASCGTLTVTDDSGGGGVESPWEVSAPTLVSATEPLTAGDTVELRAEAENVDDDSETLVIDGSQVTGGTKSCRVRVNGTQVATIEFRAALGTVVSTTFEVQVPDTSNTFSVAVCGATSNFSAEPAPEGVFEIGSVSLSTQNASVGESVSITTELLCTGGPNDDPCPAQQYSVQIDGQTVKSEEIGPWGIAQTGEVTTTATMNQTGDRTVTVTFGDASVTRTITVTDDSGSDGDDGDDGGGGGGTNAVVIGAVVLALAYAATRGN